MKMDLRKQIIENAVLRINNKLTKFTVPKIIFKKDLYENKGREGEYNFNTNKIYIQQSDGGDRMEWILIHEIGHFIHWRYFKAKNLQFETFNHNGHCESFAETFTDYIFNNSELIGDLLKMDDSLKSVNLI